MNLEDAEIEIEWLWQQLERIETLVVMLAEKTLKDEYTGWNELENAIKAVKENACSLSQK